MPMLLTLCDSHRRMQRGRSSMLPAPSMNVDFIPNLINHRVIATIHFVRDVKSLGAYVSASGMSVCLCVCVVICATELYALWSCTIMCMYFPDVDGCCNLINLIGTHCENIISHIKYRIMINYSIRLNLHAIYKTIFCKSDNSKRKTRSELNPNASNVENFLLLNDTISMGWICYTCFTCRRVATGFYVIRCNRKFLQI